jgi:hypothetical protein
LIKWREECGTCAGVGHWIDSAGGLCSVCSGLGHIPIAGAPSFSLESTLADREPGDIVVIGTGDRVRVQWHQPRKAPRQKPITTFVGLIESDFGDDELEHTTPIPLPSSFGVLEVIHSRIAGDANEGGRGNDAVDPVTRGARANRGNLL